MKSGLTLEELAVKLEADKARIKDYAVDTRQLRVLASAEGGATVHLPGVDDLVPSDMFHRQLGTDLKIRADFYDRMRDKHPELYTTLVNGLLDRWDVDYGKAGRRMVRTYLDGGGADGTQPIARAVLSEKYRRIDHYELLLAVMPMIAKIPNVQIQSAEVTETRMYLKVVAPLTEVNLNDLITGEHVMLPNEPDFCQAGFVIKNSEVGHGSLSIEDMIYRLVCKNGLIVGKSFRKTHVGSNVTAGEDLSIYRDETLAADDKALMMKVQDAVSASVDATRFEQLATQFAAAKNTEPMVEPIKAMAVLAPTVGLSEQEGLKALEHLLTVGDRTQFGAVNAITRMAQDVESYDRSTELEELAASKVLNMSGAEWGKVAAVTV